VGEGLGFRERTCADRRRMAGAAAGGAYGGAEERARGAHTRGAGTPPSARRGSHRHHYRRVATSSRATSGSLGGSDGYIPVAPWAGVPGSGGVAHRTPVDLPTRRAGRAWVAGAELP